MQAISHNWKVFQETYRTDIFYIVCRLLSRNNLNDHLPTLSFKPRFKNIFIFGHQFKLLINFFQFWRYPCTRWSAARSGNRVPVTNLIWANLRFSFQLTSQSFGSKLIQYVICILKSIFSNVQTLLHCRAMEFLLLSIIKQCCDILIIRNKSPPPLPPQKKKNHYDLSLSNDNWSAGFKRPEWFFFIF